MADQEQFEQEPVHIPVETPPQRNWQSLVYPALVIAFVLVAGMIYWFQKPQTAQNQEQQVVEEDSDAWKTYTNDEFGFELTFGDDWKGYFIQEFKADASEGNPALINFVLPSDHPAADGGEIPLSIYVYPLANWTALTQEAKDKVNYITKNRDYVYAYTQWDKPLDDDLADLNLEIRKVASSLRLTKLPADNGTKWQVYTNETFGFEFQYPDYVTAGGIASNSSLGTYQKPVKGIYAGFNVLVPLENQELVKMANEIVDGALDTAKNPQPAPEEGFPPIECKEEKYSNANSIKIKAVSCTGEGGPAFYAIIDGPKTDIFVDGYSGGFGGSVPPNAIKKEDMPAFFASFKFK